MWAYDNPTKINLLGIKPFINPGLTPQVLPSSNCQEKVNQTTTSLFHQLTHFQKSPTFGSNFGLFGPLDP